MCPTRFGRWTRTSRQAGLTVLNEMGLDPGIDHMSAMRILDRIRAEGGRMEAFESYCGGLVAPESDDNPWGYKFSWNPRNVILAGQGGAAKYIRDGATKYIPYHKLFKQTVRVAVEGLGSVRWLCEPRFVEVPLALRLGRHPDPATRHACVRPATVRPGIPSCNWVAPRMVSPWSCQRKRLERDYLDAFLPHCQECDTRENLANYLGLERARPGDAEARLARLVRQEQPDRG
jgi:hypothetical protein